MHPSEVRKRIRSGLNHLLFCIRLYKIQIREGRYFLHEHPWGAWSWKVPDMVSLLSESGVKCVKGHMCAHGMYGTTAGGEAAPVFKPTGWASNSLHILEHMSKQCSNLIDNPAYYNKHASLQQSRAARAAIYPEQLCYSSLRPA